MLHQILNVHKSKNTYNSGPNNRGILFPPSSRRIHKTQIRSPRQPTATGYSYGTILCRVCGVLQRRCTSPSHSTTVGVTTGRCGDTPHHKPKEWSHGHVYTSRMHKQTHITHQGTGTSSSQCPPERGKQRHTLMQLPLSILT